MKTSAPLLLVLVTGLAVPGFAGPKEDAEAKTAFTRAKRYFEAEEYEAALPHFQRAYELSGRRPSTIFGLAQCLRLLKRYDEAIQRFEEYVKTDPEDRAEVEETILLLRDLQADKQRQTAAPEPAPATKAAPPPEKRPDPAPAPELAPPDAPRLSAPEPAPSPPLTAHTTPPSDEDDSLFESPWFWIVTGAVAVGAGVAIGVGVASSSEPGLFGGSTGVVLRPGE